MATTSSVVGTKTQNASGLEGAGQNDSAINFGTEAQIATLTCSELFPKVAIADTTPLHDR
jgi:hypothetical protein